MKVRAHVLIILDADEYKTVHAGNLLESCGFTIVTWVGSSGPPNEGELGGVKYIVDYTEENHTMLKLKHKDFELRDIIQLAE